VYTFESEKAVDDVSHFRCLQSSEVPDSCKSDNSS
jgi:hypothetical protein